MIEVSDETRKEIVKYEDLIQYSSAKFEFACDLINSIQQCDDMSAATFCLDDADEAIIEIQEYLSSVRNLVSELYSSEGNDEYD